MSMVNRIFVLILFILVIPFGVFSQIDDEELYQQIPVFNKKENRIRNPDALYNFFAKLQLIDSGIPDVVRIVHIGDSHIQADLMTSIIRKSFQKKFGNAGRGLVFPYRVAKTTEPSNLKSSGVGVFESKRIVVTENPLPIGVTGITLKVLDNSSVFTVKVIPEDGFDYSFTRITVFHEKGENDFNLFITDSVFNKLAFLDATEDSLMPFNSEATLPYPIRSFGVEFNKSDSRQKECILYGFVLENDRPGVRYDMIGVNGAEYRHYNLSESFFDQLASLSPDLIIVSLGTNDAYPYRFNSIDYSKEVAKFCTSIRHKVSTAEVLICSPPDGYRNRKYKNYNLPIARDTMFSIAEASRFACWDLWSVMGGTGSAGKWLRSGCMQKDYIHFTRKGYELQGALLFNALMKAYAQFVEY